MVVAVLCGGSEVGVLRSCSRRPELLLRRGAGEEGIWLVGRDAGRDNEQQRYLSREVIAEMGAQGMVSSAKRRRCAGVNLNGSGRRGCRVCFAKDRHKRDATSAVSMLRCWIACALSILYANRISINVGNMRHGCFLVCERRETSNGAAANF